jgi:hypothetical protein
MPKFPAKKLVPAKATITAQLNGVPNGPRGVYLGFTTNIEFRPLEYEDGEYEPSMGWDLMPIPGVRDWRRLEGVRVEGTNPGKNGEPALEGAFLIHEWDGAVESSLSIGTRRGSRFAIDAAMVVDFSGCSGDDSEPTMPVRAKTDAVFRGLWVPPQAYKGGVEGAKKAAAPHMDLDALEAPIDQGKGSFFFPPKLTDAEKAADAKAADAAVEANRPPPPKPPADAIRLAKGLSLMHVEPPEKREVKKARANVPGFVNGHDSKVTTAAPRCVLALMRSTAKLLVVHGQARRTAKLPDFPDLLVPRWSEDAALVLAKGELHRVALPSAKVTRAWRPPAGDGTLGNGFTFWVPMPWAQPFGAGRLVVYTPKRVLVLEERKGKLVTHAELRVKGCEHVVVSDDGRFLLIERGRRRYLLLGLKDGRLRELGSFESKHSFEGAGGPLFARRGDHPLYALVGHEELYAKLR